MMNLKKIIQIGLITTLVSVTAFSQAASNGSVAATSTGSMNLSVTVPKMIVITGITDPAAATFSGSDVSLNSSLCVGTNSSAGYTVTATSNTAGTGGNFLLTDGAATPTTVAYNVAWAFSAGVTTGGTAFGSSGATLTSSGSVSNIGCALPDASVIITVPAANLQTVTANTYIDTLTLTVAPQ
jgi:hypothetical protein